MDDTLPALRAEVDAMCAHDRIRRTLLRHCTGADPTRDLGRFNTRIHADDQMLLHSLRHHRDASAALSQYFSIAQQQHRSVHTIQRLLFPNPTAVDVLDFACGYGRLLRFLSLSMPRDRIWASDLQSQATTWVAEAFGVHAIDSSSDPARFEPNRRFDMIWVASLFSHLPQDLFQAWLARLIALLTPTGVLCFSVRDTALLPAANSAPTGGFLYTARSEDSGIDADIYGTAWASADFVQRAVHVATADRRGAFRLPRALANEQDLYVVAADRQRDLSVLAGFRRGPWGWLDRRRLSESGEIVLEGRAASLDDGAVDHVGIEIDGTSHRCSTGIARPDVAEVFADDRLANAGWTFRTALSPETHSVSIAVSAKSMRGETALIHTGYVTRETG